MRRESCSGRSGGCIEGCDVVGVYAAIGLHRYEGRVEIGCAGWRYFREQEGQPLGLCCYFLSVLLKLDDCVSTMSTTLGRRANFGRFLMCAREVAGPLP